MKKFIKAFLFSILLSSCSVYMAATQEDKKDMSVIQEGTPRSLVLGKLGQPVNTEKEKGVKKDFFSFTHGYSGGNKAMRAVGHGVLDIFTLGLWEIVGTPVEILADGEKVNMEITYDEEDKVDSYKVFVDGKVVNIINGKISE